MLKLSIPAALLLIAAGANAASLKPMTAEYAVLRDGKVVGEASYALKANGDGTWALHSVTKGSAGMARLLGLDVEEDAQFRWRNGRAEGLHYTYRQDAAIKHKQREIDFDWRSGQAHVHDNRKRFDYAIPEGAIDRSTVAVALGAALADGIRTTNLAVATKDHIEQQQFAAAADESIRVPAGTFHATRFERTDVHGKARSWYAAEGPLLPVRVEQTQGDGSTIVMELKPR